MPRLTALLDHGGTAEQVETLRYRTFTGEDTHILPMSYKGVDKYTRGQEEEEGLEGMGGAGSMAKDKSAVNKSGRPVHLAAASGKRYMDSDAASISGDASREVGDEMELADDATTDEAGGRGSAKAGSSKGKAKAKAKQQNQSKQAQGGLAFGSSSLPMRSTRVNRKYVIDADADDNDDSQEEAGADVSDEY